jgi:hypothetical protein
MLATPTIRFRPDIVNLLSGKYPIRPEINFLLSGNFRFRPDRTKPYPVHLYLLMTDK